MNWVDFMFKKLLSGMLAWGALCLAATVTLPGETLSSLEIEGSYKKALPPRFDSNLYSIEKRLLKHNEARDAFQYQLSLQARRDLRDVLLVESLPEGVTFVEATPTPDRVDGRELFWKVPVLANGSERLISVSVTTGSVGTFITRSWVSADIGVSLPIMSDLPAGLHVTKTCPEYAEAGEVIPFHVVVRNTGNRPAKNVSVLEIPPPTLSMGNFPPLVGDLQPGESREIVFTGSTLVKGRHTNLVRAFREGEDVPAEARATVTVVAPTEVGFAKTGGGAFPVGGAVTSRLILRNDGEMPMRDLFVTDVIPAGVQLASASENPVVTWPTHRRAGSLAWTVERLEPGEVRLLEFTLVSSEAREIRTEARVEGFAANGKGYGARARTKVPTVWREAPELEVSLVPDEASVRVDQAVDYKIFLSHPGGGEMAMVEIEVRFSDELKPLQVEGVKGAEILGRTVTLPRIGLAAGESGVVRIRSVGTLSGEGKVTLRAKLKGQTEVVEKVETTQVTP